MRRVTVATRGRELTRLQKCSHKKKEKNHENNCKSRREDGMKPSKKQIQEMTSADLFRAAGNVVMSKVTGDIVRYDVNGGIERFHVTEPKPQSTETSKNQLAIHF